MSDRRVPAWFTALGQTARGDRVYDFFLEILKALPMTSAELAAALDVSQATVCRWSSGRSQPSLEQMEAALVVMRARLDVMGDRVDRGLELFDLIGRAIEVTSCQCIPSDPFCETCSLRLDAVRGELLETQRRIEELIG